MFTPLIFPFSPFELITNLSYRTSKRACKHLDSRLKFGR